jgi:hypothetical protein
MVWQEEGLIVRCHSPSIEEDRHGRETEETPCAQPRFPGNRGKGADAQLEGKEAEEDVAREVASSGPQRSPDAAGGVARQNDCAATSRPARLSPRTRGKPSRARERYACSAPLAPSLPHRRRRSGGGHQIDGLVRLGASDHDLGDWDSPCRCRGGVKSTRRAERLALGRAPPRAGRARSGRRSTCPWVDRGRRRLPEP